MARLEDLNSGTYLKGLSPTGLAQVVSVKWMGQQAVEIFFRDSHGEIQSRLVYRDEEEMLNWLRKTADSILSIKIGE